MAEGKKGIIVSLSIMLTLMLILGFLVFDSTHGVSQQYVLLFLGIYFFSIIGCIVFLLWGLIKHDDDETFAPRIYDDNEDRPLSGHAFFKIAGMILLALVFAGWEIAQQSSVIPIINPYNAANLITANQLSTISSTTLTALRSGIYAGFGEDMAGFVMSTIFTLIILLIFKSFSEEPFESKPLIALAILTSSLLWGVFFATAHELAYGINIQAYISAFAYGFSSQFVNQLVGAPVSILAHFTHNFIVIFSAGMSLSIGGIPAGIGTSANLMFLKIKNWRTSS
jgi:hypothetical protein